MEKASSKLTVPVAMVIFKRPELTKRVLAAVAQARPRQLFVIADGPRTPEEAALCEQTRSILEGVNWECEVFTHFSERNLGCGMRVSSGLDWVFSQVEEAIILEDDCVPSVSFFRFCEELLARYRSEERIMHIGGNNFLRGLHSTGASYYFSRYAFIWGWATWRRAWCHYDFHMRAWPAFRQTRQFRRLFPDRVERAHWTHVLDEVQRGAINTWDMQWLLTCWQRDALAVVPSVNLVSNVGFGTQATHTVIETPQSAVPADEMGELLHPSAIDRHRAADEQVFNTVFEGHRLRREQSLEARLRRRLYPWKQRVLSWLRP